MTRVDIGVFAHNEARCIVRVLEGLLRQETTGMDLRILVLANGCKDDTAKLAQAFAQARADTAKPDEARVDVVDLPEGGSPEPGTALSMI
ncbi:MAG: glycosyltransferase [Burkholderiaceae bacterium]